MALAAPHAQALASPYDEAVVPALRKRLQAESQMLERRLSTHSSFADAVADLPPATPSAKAQSQASASSSTSADNKRPRVASPELYDRPTGIPRPSLQMAHSSSSYGNGVGSMGSRSDRIPQASTLAGPSSSRQRQVSSNEPRIRSRTVSSPFLSSVDTPAAPAQSPSALPTPASSRSTSPLVATAAANAGARPSGIPIPARTRSRTDTSTATSATDENNINVPNPVSAQLQPPMQQPQTGSMRYPPSPEPSADMHFERLRAVQAPFDSESAEGRSSTERERDKRQGQAKEYEFWYRGDKARNGGRGEVHKVGTAEMLEIAAFGHRLRDERKGMGAGAGAGAGQWAGVEEPEQQGAELEDESVMRERPLTWVVDPEGSVTDLVLEEMRKGEERDKGKGANGVVNGNAKEKEKGKGKEAVTPMRFEPRGPPKGVLSQSAPPGARPAALTAKPIQSSSLSKPNGAARTGRTSATPSSTPSRQRLPSRPTKAKPAATPAEPQVARSQSQPTHLRTESATSVSLVDAIPDVPKRRAEAGKNWDEVVLPTVARRLGLDTEVDDTAGEFGERAKEEEAWAPPAPGTFGYRERSPSTTFQPHPLHPAPALPAPAPAPPTDPLPPLIPPTYPPPPARQPSPAPFSSYSPLPTPRPASPPPERPAPVLLKSDTAIGRAQMSKGKKPPKIVVSGQPAQAAAAEDDGKHGGGCKCVIM